MKPSYQSKLVDFTNGLIKEATELLIKKYNLSDGKLVKIDITEHYEIDYMFDEYAGLELIETFDRISYEENTIRLYITESEDDYIELNWFCINQLTELLDELL
ncbi:MAG: hypothetical protein RSE41_00040 [Clostridia bacterium]